MYVELDEATAIMVQGDTIEVIEKSYVAVYDFNTILDSEKPHDNNGAEDFKKCGRAFFLFKQ